jgi:hypothetical protein
VQRACVVHIVRALLSADQTLKFLRQRKRFRLASGLPGLSHLRGKRVDRATTLSQCRLIDRGRGYHENGRGDRASALHDEFHHKPAGPRDRERRRLPIRLRANTRTNPGRGNSANDFLPSRSAGRHD